MKDAHNGVKEEKSGAETEDTERLPYPERIGTLEEMEGDREREAAEDDTKRLDWLDANNATVGKQPHPDMGGNDWYLRCPTIASSKLPRRKSPREAIDAAMSQTKEKE